MQRGALFAAALLFAAAAKAEEPRDVAFDVYRKGELIGAHEIAFRRNGDDLEATIDIRLQVDVLFLPVYRYRHQNRETWRDGRLVRIETETDDNGDSFYVKGEAGPDGFRVESTAGAHVAPADVIPTSWWRPDTVRRSALLNSQRGEMMRVEITPLGEEQVETAAGAVSAQRYRVDGDAQLELWYEADGRLAKIRFAGSDGAPIEYRRRD